MGPRSGEALLLANLVLGCGGLGPGEVGRRWPEAARNLGLFLGRRGGGCRLCLFDIKYIYPAVRGPDGSWQLG